VKISGSNEDEDDINDEDNEDAEASREDDDEDEVEDGHEAREEAWETIGTEWRASVAAEDIRKSVRHVCTS